MIEIASIIIGVLTAAVIRLSSAWFKNRKCNSSYNRNKDSLVIRLPEPEYIVCAIKQEYAKGGGGYIAKYTLKNAYQSGKEELRCQTLVLYDEIGKYNLWDRIIFAKKEKK